MFFDCWTIFKFNVSVSSAATIFSTESGRPKGIQESIITQMDFCVKMKNELWKQSDTIIQKYFITINLENS